MRSSPAAASAAATSTAGEFGFGRAQQAEGVTNADQADTLTSLNCDLAQGYYWSEPQSADTITKLLERGTIRPGAAQQIDWKAPATAAFGSTMR